MDGLTRCSGLNPVTLADRFQALHVAEVRQRKFARGLALAIGVAGGDDPLLTDGNAGQSPGRVSILGEVGDGE